MTDKERILSVLVQKLMPRILFPGSQQYELVEYRSIQPSLTGVGLVPGDLVVAATTHDPNNFMVGFFEKQIGDTYYIREIGTDRVTKYINEIFYKVPKDFIGFEVLEGIQYQIYRKCLKATTLCKYPIMFHKIEFSPDSKTCYLYVRRKFSGDTLFFICFHYTTKTTIKSIVSELEDFYESMKRAKSQLC